jgi:hypothetical protein
MCSVECRQSSVERRSLVMVELDIDIEKDRPAELNSLGFCAAVAAVAAVEHDEIQI